MKKLSFILLLLASLAGSSQAQYKPVEPGSTLKFTIRNLGFGVDGTFTGFEGTINWDAQNPTNSSFDVTLNAATVNTDNGLRDDHLKGDSFFDVKNYPRIRLTSAKILPGRKSGQFTATGQLTIKGKSKPVTFPFTVTPSADGFVFNGTFKMLRKDYGVGGTSTVSDELEVTINVLAKKA